MGFPTGYFGKINTFDVDAPVQHMLNADKTAFTGEGSGAQGFSSTRNPMIDRTPGLSIPTSGLLGKSIGTLGLGKAGMFGVPYLGALPLAYNGVNMLGKALGLWGRKKAVDPYAEVLSQAQQNAAEAAGYGGELGRLGMDLQTSGRAEQLRGRSGMLNAAFSPEALLAERTSLASQYGNATRANPALVGLLGGPGALSQYQARQASYNPNLAAGLTQIGSNQRNRAMQGYGQMANFGQQDFGQGLGLRNQGFQIGQAGRSQYAGAVERSLARKERLKAQSQSGVNALFGALGTGLGSGLFNPRKTA